MATVTQSLGKVSIILRGDYDASTQYERLDVVSYNGSSYCAKDTTTGHLPTDTNYWNLIAQKGDTGSTGSTGATGPAGPTGNGISSISGPQTAGAVDTYIINFTDGSTFEFEITNGDGSDWSDIRNKPFESVDSTFFKMVANVLKLSDAVKAKLDKVDTTGTVTEAIADAAYINDVSNDFAVVEKHLLLSTAVSNKIKNLDSSGEISSDHVTYGEGKITQKLSEVDKNVANGFLQGSNLINSIEQGGFVEETGVDISNSNALRTPMIEVKSNANYTFNIATTSSAQVAIFEYNSSKTNGQAVTGAWITSFPITFTTKATTKYVKISFCNSSFSAVTPSFITDVMLEEGSTFSGFEKLRKSNVQITEELSSMTLTYTIETLTSNDGGYLVRNGGLILFENVVDIEILNNPSRSAVLYLESSDTSYKKLRWCLVNTSTGAYIPSANSVKALICSRK